MKSTSSAIYIHIVIAGNVFENKKSELMLVRCATSSV